ncbi:MULTISPECIES: MarR family winged helix-turn-helix transcriptional regulator [unclassified Rathayibacter]|uniref:MarR family winged helix-turn-helix transcriptional regulator n=1 Tax=unclassified Rathayibacter TaxID=2609250 RepID=UPI0006F40CC1|nr:MULTISPECIES: transcriptional regulator [unclassified Rathayibacter]KQQ05467.1 transcriptional regulator [Rathayibacter sp. Leaf294]KQS13330.1 transcriptional regulator [Rathayibacter sp. Leaf185]
MTDQRPIGYWLTLVDRLIEERFARTLDEHGVTRMQWQLLELLRRGPAAVGALDRALAPFLPAAPAEEPSSVAEHLAELVESGWVADEGDVFALTEQGGVATARLEEVVGTARTAVTEGVSDEDHERTVATLRRIAANLGWDDAV